MGMNTTYSEDPQEAKEIAVEDEIVVEVDLETETAGTSDDK